RLVVAQQIARAQLQILEVERGLAVLAFLISSGEAVQQFLQQIAVGRGELVERRLLDELARLFVRSCALTAQSEVAKIEDPVGARVGVEIRDGLPGRLALRVAGSFVVGEAVGGFAKLVDATTETRALPQLEDELAARRPERLVDAGEHPPQPVGPVDGEEPQPRGIVCGAESGQRLREGLAAEHAALAVVDHAEPWVDACGERMRAQQPVAEAVDRGDPRPVELAREVWTSTLDESRTDPAAQLAGRLLGVGDHEDRFDVDALVADGTRETLDEHLRLARPGSGRDEDEPTRIDCALLFRVELHARLTRHIDQSSHQVGQSPLFGSCLTSPLRIRSTMSTASSRARSTWPQKASSSR